MYPGRRCPCAAGYNGYGRHHDVPGLARAWEAATRDPGRPVCGHAPRPRDCLLDPTPEASDGDAGEETEIGAVQYWYLEGRGWVREVEGDGELRRALVWTGDHDVWVRVARPEGEEDVARLEGYRRAVRDRIVWMTCLDPRDPGGGRPEDQMERLQELTGERFTTAADWLAWWRANAEQLQLTTDGRGLLAVPQVQNDAASAPTGPAAQRSEILSLRVLRESADTVLVALEYVYAGDHGGEASIGAITLLDGSSLGHWAYRPAPVFPGRHTAHVTLTVNDQAGTSRTRWRQRSTRRRPGRLRERSFPSRRSG